MRGRIIAAATAVLLFAQTARAEDTTGSSTALTPEEEIAKAQATLAESNAAAGPALERGTPHKASAWPWVLGGAGVAGLVTGGIFGAVSLSDQSKSDDFTALAGRSNNPNEKAQLEASAQKNADSADSTMTIAAIAGGAGLVLLAAGIVWAIVDSPSAPKSAQIGPGGLTATF